MILLVGALFGDSLITRRVSEEPTAMPRLRVGLPNHSLGAKGARTEHVLSRSERRLCFCGAKGMFRHFLFERPLVQQELRTSFRKVRKTFARQIEDSFNGFLFLDRVKDLSRAQEFDQLLVLPFAGMNLSQNHRERQS